MNLERADSGLMRCFEQVYHILVLDMLYGSHLSTGTCLRKKKVGKWNLAENTIGQIDRQRKALFVHIIEYLDNESSGRRMETKKDGL